MHAPGGACNVVINVTIQPRHHPHAARSELITSSYELQKVLIRSRKIYSDLSLVFCPDIQVELVVFLFSSQC